SGELLRDQALAVAGLLSSKMYGPPVRPMRPASGLTAAFGGSNDWTTSPGEDARRRSVYTDTRRNSPYPSFTTFDAPNRETCTLRRGRSNTPLQAFVTLNDPVFVEASQGLARRVLKEGPKDTAGRLHTKENLMQELGKVHRVIEKLSPVDEVLLVIDATTGQNGMNQARVFIEAVGVTGLIITKLDGSAKGGVGVAVEKEFGLPIKYIGSGEQISDLAPFDAERFIEGLLE
ncbi:MAG: hypothetical protein RLZZ586_1463, partial [Pseudomonadota bacterium]